MIKKVLWCGLLIIFGSLTAVGQANKEKWVDSVFHTLSLNEKIGQMFMTRISSHVEPDILKTIEKKIESHHIGGVIFTTGSAGRQARITNRIQSNVSIPLLISQDASAGLGHLLDSALTFPIPLAQGAISNDSMVYWMSREVGRQMRVLGIHMSLSPNASTIGAETTNRDLFYGDDPMAVGRKSMLHMTGLHDEGVLSCAKFFPLKSIAVIDQKGKSQIKLYHDSLLSYPYRALFKNGLNAVIPDATDLPEYFEAKKSDLRKKVSENTFAQFEAGNFLHQPMNYDGVVIIDIQTLQSVTDKFEPGDGELFAFQAGADLMITDNDLDAAFRKIKKLIRTEKQYGTRLDQRVKKILGLKYDAGLSEVQPVNIDLLETNLHTTKNRLLRIQSYKNSITVVNDDRNMLPILSLEDKNFTCLIAGDTSRGKIFYKTVKKYVRAIPLIVTGDLQEVDLSAQDVIIAALFPSTTPKVLQNVLYVLETLQAHQQIIIADFGCKIFKPHAARYPTIITGYTDDEDIVHLVPQAIFGGLPVEGVLPVKYGDILSGTAFKNGGLKRLSYSFPEDGGIDGNTLKKIDRIAREAIADGATPGCHVLVAKKGKVIYDKSFGHLTYDKQIPVTDETIYDLASLTKVSATLQAVMFMQERNLIDINKKISVYLPELKGSNKKDITIVDMLTHQAGLAPFVPLWPLTVEGPAFMPIYYSSRQSVRYPLQISPSLFGSNVLKDSVWSWIRYSKMLEKPMRTPYSYRYSDLGFMMFKQLSERILNQPLEDFLFQNFYEPLGAYSLGYNPLKNFPQQSIAPTELDTLFRRALVLGTVHDERAAMLGGVSGHAGLFGTANDLSKLGQMLLQEGAYGGLQYYKPETIKLFTAKHFESNRRGLGWDKPVQGEWNSPTSLYASPATFGHTGFTGTCLWVDPEFDLVYIFVSNRVFPDRNDKLITKNIRSRIQDVVYEAIFNYCKTLESEEFDAEIYSKQ